MLTARADLLTAYRNATEYAALWLARYTIKRWTPAAKAAHWKAIDRIAVSWERPFREQASKDFEQDRRAILALLREAQKAALRQKATIDWNNLILNVQKYLEGQSQDRWRKTFVPLVSGVVTDQGERWGAALGLTFSVQNLEARDWFNQYTLKFAQEIAGTTKDNIAEIIAKGQAEGASIPTMQKQINRLFDRYISGELPTDDLGWFTSRTPAYRTELIARTETMRSSNAGSNQIFKDWGVTQKEWLSTIDNRTRDSHASPEVNGQVVGIDQPFIVNGYQMMHPLDSSLGAPMSEIANCRCAELPVVGGEADTGASQGRSVERMTDGKEWSDSLSSGEKRAIRHWGKMGNDLRKLQSGHGNVLSDYERQIAEELLPYWESAIERGVEYEGTIYRGLSSVPYDEAIKQWMDNGIIELMNDQSASYNAGVGNEFAVSGWANHNAVVWQVEQSSGINLFGETNVTMGGKSISEYEIIMRKGTQYKIETVEYIKDNGKRFDSDWYFEGTEYSWPDNPPEPGWHPGKDFRGHYLIRLTEIIG